MIEVKKHGILLNKTILGFENEGVLNPAVISENGVIHMYYRAVAKGNYSSIGYCILKDPLTVSERMDAPLIFPHFDYESHGVEDPRITKIDDIFYLSYTAFDGTNALGALAISKDLKHFDKKGIIVPMFPYSKFSRLAGSKSAMNEKYCRYNFSESEVGTNGKPAFVWDKNLIFFPRRINGKLCFLHRIRPDIQLVTIKSLDDLDEEFWENYFMDIDQHIVLTPQHNHDISYIGGGCPPIETEFGWLLIYHGVHDTVEGFVYSACAALLDLDNPQKEIARLPYPLFKPEMEWEIRGEINNVCFPTGAIVEDNTLYMYYGAADERIACASVDILELLQELLINVKK